MEGLLILVEPGLKLVLLLLQLRELRAAGVLSSGGLCLLFRFQSFGYNTQGQLFNVAKGIGGLGGGGSLLVFVAFGFVGSFCFLRVAPFVTRKRTVVVCIESAATDITHILFSLLGTGCAGIWCDWEPLCA